MRTWVEALRIFFTLITREKYDDIHNIKISYNSIRPRGERLKTFGGSASGYETIKEMFDGIDRVFKDAMDKTIEPMEEVDGFLPKYHVRPIHVLDICTLLGNNVVSGGVRRTAIIFLCDENDYESMLAKYGVGGIWDKEAHSKLGEKLYAIDILPDWWNDEELLESKTGLTHRYMSNNSIMFKNIPSEDLLSVVFDLIKTNGEPGFVNQEEMLRRRPNGKGVNPCAEIILDSKQTCNLTTINVFAFVKEQDGEFSLDIPAMLNAQTLSVRAGMRMTLVDLELDEWDEKHKRDRLVGTSLTGWRDMVDKVGLSIEEQNGVLNMLKEISFNESLRYANALRIPNPLLVTTVKPEGTLSQVAGGVSSGLHVSHSPYFIRRVRINANDPLARLAIDLGWNVTPEVGTTWDDAKILVIDFPMKTPAKQTRGNQSLKEQFDTYFQFQEYYTQHNSSNTITVRDHEWEEAQQIILDGWDSFVGVSFLPYDGGTYDLMPYEEISKEEYEIMVDNFKSFNIEDLYEIETSAGVFEVEDECESGG